VANVDVVVARCCSLVHAAARALWSRGRKKVDVSIGSETWRTIGDWGSVTTRVWSVSTGAKTWWSGWPQAVPTAWIRSVPRAPLGFNIFLYF
jgi:hypothetical protein